MRPVAFSQRLPCLTVALLVAICVPHTVTPQQENSFASWTDGQKEEFLLHAKIVRTETLDQGVTLASRAELMRDGIEHDGQLQNVEISKPSYPPPRGYELNFKDSYKFNIAAYRLNRLLGLGMVPVSVPRVVRGKASAVTWWVDDVEMREKTRYLKKLSPPDRTQWNRQMHNVRVFDQLIYNTDRNLGNLVITNTWKIWMIDHTRAFRIHERLDTPRNLLKCGRELFAAMKTLTREELDRELDDHLTKSEIKALLARRDLIVALFEDKTREKGESAQRSSSAFVEPMGCPADDVALSV